MRFSAAVLVPLLAVAPLAAQYRSVGGFGNVAFPATGHAPVISGNPWGNVAFPAVPGGAYALSGGQAAGTRYGNLVPGFRNHGGAGQGGGHHNNRGTGIFAYPVFVGGYGYGNGYYNDQPQSNEGAPTQQGQPPVVINQYFGTPPPDQGPPQEAPPESNFHYYQAPTDQPAASSTDTQYYLIAFKDHTIYSAVAYYTEGDTLHYFTGGNVHNQVSLTLVDRALTEQLNRERNVAVNLP